MAEHNIRRGDLCVFKRDAWVHLQLCGWRPTWWVPAGTAALAIDSFDDESVHILILGQFKCGYALTSALERLDDP